MAASSKFGPKDPSSAVPPPAAGIPRPATQSQYQYQPRSQPRDPSQPQSQPQPSPSQSQSQSQPQSPPQSPPQPQPQSESQKPHVDGVSYYGYLFREDKAPTKTLSDLLYAIGQYIIDHIGDINDKQLSPRKLAAFYHAVGGDYDALFIKTPDRNISYILQILGVQHSLQPMPDNDFSQPSIPTLTLKGFVRWQSLQILLDPQEHVPFMQHAVANWDLKNPHTGEGFPVDLPVTAFPAECDPAVDEWHKSCGEKLRNEAAASNKGEEKPPPHPDIDPHINTVPNNAASGASARPTTHHRPESEYFRSRRPMPYTHIPETQYPSHTSHPGHPGHPGHPSQPIIPETNHRVSSSSGSSLEELSKSRRHSGIKPPPVFVRDDSRASAHLDPNRPSNFRRHSHTYQSPYIASAPNSDSEPDVLRGSPRRNAPLPPQPPLGVRRIAVPPSMPTGHSGRSRPSEMRAEESRRVSRPSKMEKLASFWSSSSRHRSSSREPGPDPHASVRYAKEHPRTRPSRSLSGESFTSDGSLPEILGKYSPRDSRERNRTRARTVERILEQDRDRERDRDRDRERERNREFERERERERERGRERERERAREREELEKKDRKEKAYLRPSISRRTSSHADAERRRQDVLWEARDRRKDGRDLDREFKRNLTSDDLDRPERRRYNDRGLSPTLIGVSGRKYLR